MEEEVKIKEMKMEMKKRAFEFSRNKTVKKKCEIPIQKIKKFEAKALDWFWFRF